jgi:hypothetical protein
MIIEMPKRTTPEEELKFLRICRPHENQEGHYWNEASGLPAADPPGHTFATELMCPQHANASPRKWKIRRR